ncbi:unnamed protein product [Lymnaea stagnalis]|uniref:Coiled-coil domain-containing protein 60 n=1 Tax=Lymnaea stagnalis TaxID=6523 RepID=A0AAV2H3X6_LYMST
MHHKLPPICKDPYRSTKMPSRDPRTYVRAVPLPIPSQKGLRLQARSDMVYNPCSPTRDQVRKWNYDRRRQQMTDQGFYAHNYEPYKGLGDPVYLDERKMVLNALGQWDEDESQTSSSSEEEEEPVKIIVTAPQASLNAAKFVLRRTRKDLNNLNKEIVKGRAMIRNVQLGHGLFHMIKQERLSKRAAREEELRKRLVAARTQWQPPKDSSSEDETDIDEDLEKEENLENFFGPDVSDLEDLDYTGTPASSSIERLHNSDDPSKTFEETQSRGITIKSLTSAKKKKKRQPLSPRPYTPQHTNLIDMPAKKEQVSSTALFRQLCALNWILEAMNIEQNMSMGPISTCWRLIEQEIGGSKVAAKKPREDKRTEWDKFLSNAYTNRAGKKGSMSRMTRFPRPSRQHLIQPRFSIQSSISPSSSISQVIMDASHVHKLVNTSGVQGVHPLTEQTTDNQQPTDSRSATPQEAEEDEALYKTSVFKFLDEYYDSLRREAQQEEERLKSLGAGGSDLALSPAHLPHDGGDLKNSTHSDGSHKKDKLSKHDLPDESSKSKSSNTHQESSQGSKTKGWLELQEFHATKLSNKYMKLSQDLHNKFKEIQDDKAMTLHDVLEQMERERYIKCQNKFRSLQTRSVSFYRAVDEMRRKGKRMVPRPEDVRRQSSIKGSWYSDLISSLPYDVKEKWYYRTVLQKLGRYGLVENTVKQSVYKFLKVLESLRHWEICNPDISAAIEFCRAKIVDMSVDEYELWFSQAFPKVQRPKTAPANISNISSVNPVSSSKNTSWGISRSRDGKQRLDVRLAVPGGAISNVSVMNGTEGRLRLVQSAVVQRQ